MVRPRVLVTGGAGYIGSHVVQALLQQGLEPIVFDNFSYGHREAARGVDIIEGDLACREGLIAALDDRRIVAVVHLAAFAYVGESVTEPAKYYRNNVVGTLNLLDAMTATGKTTIVASSSCTTYGDPRYLPLDEQHEQLPVSPYGRSKLALEQMIRDFHDAYGFRHVIFRYFNAAGASRELGEDHTPETHLIPNILDVPLGRNQFITVHGDDYPTRDGSCVRDYVHVEDLAAAHALAVQRLLDGGASGEFNLGSEHGASVFEVIETARRITRRPIPTLVGPRRPGDPPELVASAKVARQELGWRPQRSDLETILATAWHWRQRHPCGYADNQRVRLTTGARQRQFRAVS